jgi:phosphohistidine phosphatase
MKRLLILRHAKSSWKDLDLEDHDRPLNKRGERDAPRMGRLMRSEGVLPELALSSTAKRARATVEQALEAAGAACEIRLSPDLYLASPVKVVQLLRGTPERYVRVMIVGHNPGLEELVQELTGQPVTMPTAALAVVDCPCGEWNGLDLTGTADLVRFWKPKELDPEKGGR